ncbi:MAG TPA: sigma-70 family RNA polymerase sigma factor [Rhizomicrobium sp.]|nr:sigma-70 family RNA polymerase sigma factor [Rhizomicrobium sp.]
MPESRGGNGDPVRLDSWVAGEPPDECAGSRGHNSLSLHASSEPVALDCWFVAEVLPLEQTLVRYMRRHWPDAAEIPDLRQEVYIRIYEAARYERPAPIKPYLLLTARNLMIDRLRRKNVVKIETLDEIGWQEISDNEPSPEQRVAARQELRRMQRTLDELPPRCREVIVLRRIHGLSQREVAARMGIREDTVESQIAKGMQILADAALNKRGNLIANVRRLRIFKD